MINKLSSRINLGAVVAWLVPDNFNCYLLHNTLRVFVTENQNIIIYVAKS